MPTSIILWESEEDIYIDFPRAKDTLYYKGILKILGKKYYPVTLKINRIHGTYVMDELMEEEVCFSGNSITEVYCKMSKYFNKYGMLLRP